MEPVQPAAAPAQPAPAAAPLSPMDQAVADGDVSAFRELRRAALKDPNPVAVAAPAADDADDDDDEVTPAAPVAPAAGAAPAAPGAPAAAAAAPGPKISKRQQEINEHIRARTTAELEAKQLREQLAQLQPRREPAPAPAAGAADDPEPNPEDAAKYPAGQYEPQFVKDLSAWQARQVMRTSNAEAQQRAQRDQHVRALEERDRGFQAQLTKAKEADPNVLTTIHADVLALRPRDALREGEQPGPLNDVAECLLRSDMPIAVMQHLSDHPDVLQRLAALPTRSAVLYEMGLLHGQLKSSAAAPAPPAQNLVGDLPAPPVTLGSRPAAAGDPLEQAVASRDFSAFRAQRLRQRTAHTR